MIFLLAYLAIGGVLVIPAIPSAIKKAQEFDDNPVAVFFVVAISIVTFLAFWPVFLTRVVRQIN